MFFEGNEDDSKVEEWLDARYESFTTPRDSDSEDEITDEEKQVKEQESLPAPSEATTLDSSSDSSSENESQSQKKKKCHKKRNSDSIEKQLNSVIVKVESDQRVIDAKLNQASNFMSNLSDNIKDLTNQSI